MEILERRLPRGERALLALDDLETAQRTLALEAGAGGLAKVDGLDVERHPPAFGGDREGERLAAGAAGVFLDEWAGDVLGHRSGSRSMRMTLGSMPASRAMERIALTM